MAIQSIPGGMYVPRPVTDESAAPNELTALASTGIDAADEKIAIIIRAPKTGNIRKILWNTGTVTTGATIDVRVESVSAGLPSGTLFGANTNAAVVVNNTDDRVLFTSTLTADAAVTRGDLLSIVWVNPAVSAGNMVLAVILQDDIAGKKFPYYASQTGGSWTTRHGAFILALEYSDGSYAFIDNCWPITVDFVTIAFNSGSAANYIGNRIQFPFPCRVSGCAVWIDFDGDFAVELIGSDGVTVLATTGTLSTSIRGTGTAGQQYWLTFNTDVDLAANTVYRLVVVPKSVTNVTLYTMDAMSAAAMAAWEGGANIHYTSAGSPSGVGSWTDTATRRAMIFLRVTGFDDGAGVGGGSAFPVIGPGGVIF